MLESSSFERSRSASSSTRRSRASASWVGSDERFSRCAANSLRASCRGGRFLSRSSVIVVARRRLACESGVCSICLWVSKPRAIAAFAARGDVRTLQPRRYRTGREQSSSPLRRRAPVPRPPTSVAVLPRRPSERRAVRCPRSGWVPHPHPQLGVRRIRILSVCGSTPIGWRQWQSQ